MAGRSHHHRDWLILQFECLGELHGLKNVETKERGVTPRSELRGDGVPEFFGIGNPDPAGFSGTDSDPWDNPVPFLGILG